MKTIYSDGKTLEIERKLKITVFLPQLCHFCTEEITTFEPQKAESLIFHSLDEDHNNWELSNKRPAHKGCHRSFHVKGDNSPMKRPEVAAKVAKALKGRPHPWQVGDKNVMKDPKIKEKHRMVMMLMRGEKAVQRNKKGWATRRKKWPPNGYRDFEAWKRAVVEGKERKKVGGQDSD